jgi:hypothetical protein
MNKQIIWKDSSQSANDSQTLSQEGNSNENDIEIQSHSSHSGCHQENKQLECGWCIHCVGTNIITLNWQRPLWDKE